MIRPFSWLLLLFSGFGMADPSTDAWRLRYDERGIPIIDVKIFNRYHTLMFDTGSGAGMHLYSHNLAQILANPDVKTTPLAPRRQVDVTGKQDEISAYRIQRLMISAVPFDNVEVVSFTPWGFTLGGERPVSEVMGLGLFHDRRVLLDFKHDRLQLLTQLPADIERWSSYPVETTASGLRITAYIGNVPLHLMIDTGASHSLLFADRLPAGTLFSGCRTMEPAAANLDCRVTTMTVTDDSGHSYEDVALVTPGATPLALDFDGLLGMRFMRRHQVILDMPEHRLYLRRCCHE